MSLYELMICSKPNGGCGHARHRHTRAGGHDGIRMLGGCKTQGSDGHCPCPKFRERDEDVSESRAPSAS